MYLDDLRKVYSKLYLVRNEQQLSIYSFDDGNRFEPDFVLFLQKGDGKDFEQMQIFIEPKGENLLKQDKWKEDFLLAIKKIQMNILRCYLRILTTRFGDSILLISMENKKIG